MATLVKVMPDKIGDIWELIEHAIKSTSITNNANQILEGLLLGHYVCWAGMEDDHIKIIVLTRVVDEHFLLIHTAYTYAKIQGREYVEMFEQLKQYAIASGCDNIILYTQNEKLCEFAEKHGANVSMFITISIGE